MRVPLNSAMNTQVPSNFSVAIDRVTSLKSAVFFNISDATTLKPWNCLLFEGSLSISVSNTHDTFCWTFPHLSIIPCQVLCQVGVYNFCFRFGRYWTTCTINIHFLSHGQTCSTNHKKLQMNISILIHALKKYNYNFLFF